MKNKISNIILWIIIIAVLFIALDFYNENNFNEFVKSEIFLHTSEFKRDSEVKYSNSESYRIKSDTLNDAAFYKTVKVEKNTPYKVTCMVKTENVVAEDNVLGVGAQISIIDSSEKSMAITGTQEWQKIEMYFNSKNREEVDIAFRLGGYQGNCTGTAWFSDFTLEEGAQNKSNSWKFACFIFENTDVVVDGKRVNISMTDNDISDIKNTIVRFENTVSTLCENKMDAECEVYIVKDPITSLSYDKEFGYLVAPEDVENIIKDTVNKKNYDHIFAIIRLGNEEYVKDIEINDWIGLRVNGLLWNRIF